MYAINATGYRAVTADDVLAPGEALVYEVPQSLLDQITTAAQLVTANQANLAAEAETALADLRTFRDLASPTNAQTLAIVKVLCRVCIGLIRLQLKKLDAVT